MEKDTRHRRYLLTINNPGEDWTHEKIRAALDGLQLKYWCMADEMGLQEQTAHTHIFFAARTAAIRFSTVKGLFPTAHIDPAQGASEEVRAYVQKSGKWVNDPKGETTIPGTFEEWGELPVERQGERADLALLYEMVKGGLSNYEIMEINPDYLLTLDKIERVRQAVREQQYRDTFRILEVTYIWGETATGKTRFVMEKHGYSGVYRVTDYKHPFDSYLGEDVLLLDEFRGDIKIADMLNLVDGYPLTLPCRYTNRVACYTKVYIISNICISRQYSDVQFDSPATFRAFLRRIQKVVHYTGVNQSVEQSTADYMDDPFIPERGRR